MKLSGMQWGGIVFGAAVAGVAISKYEINLHKKVGKVGTPPAMPSPHDAIAATASAPPAIVTAQQVVTSGGAQPMDPAKLSKLMAVASA